MIFCFFSAQYLPTVGGVERYTMNLAKKMISHGHRSIIVTSALPGLSEHEIDSSGIEIWRLPVFLVMNGRFPVLRPGRRMRYLMQKIWDEKPDLCVIQTRMYSLSLYAALVSKHREIPAIVIEHSTGHMTMNNCILNGIGHVYEHLVCRLISWSGVSFYGVSLAVCQWLRHFHIEAKGILYNSVNPNELMSVASKKDWRAEFNLDHSVKLGVFVGRIIPEKGVEPLVQAFSQLQLPDTALLIAGDGPQLKYLQTRPKKNVYFLGTVPYPDTLALLQQADVYCLPTTYAEGFPTTLLEAAACRCAIVCTDTAGSAELLPDENFGIRIPSPSPEYLCPALKKAFTESVWRTEAACNCHKNLLHNFTWDKTADDLLSIALKYVS